MKTAFYYGRARRSVAAHGFCGRERRTRIVRPRRTGTARSISRPCAREYARRGAHFGLRTVAHQRTFRRLLVKAVEGRMGRLGVPCGHPALLPRCEIWRHRRLHEAASRRGERPVQGSDGVHCLARRRLVTTSASVAWRPAISAVRRSKSREWAIRRTGSRRVCGLRPRPKCRGRPSRLAGRRAIATEIRS